MARKHYARQWYAQYSKPANPDTSFTEIFADSQNNGTLTVLFPNGDTLPLENYITKLAIDTKEPTGFIDRIASLNFIVGSRTFLITGDFSFYNKGIKTTKSSDSIVIPDTIGMHYIYYNESNVITTSMVFPYMSVPLIAFVYWNGTTAILFDERHGCVMDHATHSLLHNTVGTRYQSGLSGTFTNTTLSIGSGVIWDEDIKFEISAQTVCDVFFKNGSSDFSWNANQTKYYHDNGTLVYYNNGTALATVASNQYVAYWVFATNSVSRPIITLMGQRVDDTINAARTNNTYESLSLTNLPFVEMKLLFRVILRGDKTYMETQDLRSISNVPAGTYVATDHNALSGRSNDNSHPANAITNTPAGDIQSTTVQTAINELDLRTIENLIKSVSRDNRDEYGVYTTIEYFDANLVLRKSSVLSGGIAPLYTTRTVNYYDANSQLLTTEVYALTYDENEDIIQEALQ